MVLPHGYPLPAERQGWERFVLSLRGGQRVAGFDAYQSDYILALDDDVEFDADFVEQLFGTISRTGAQLASLIIK